MQCRSAGVHPPPGVHSRSLPATSVTKLPKSRLMLLMYQRVNPFSPEITPDPGTVAITVSVWFVSFLPYISLAFQTSGLEIPFS